MRSSEAARSFRASCRSLGRRTVSACSLSTATRSTSLEAKGEDTGALRHRGGSTTGGHRFATLTSACGATASQRRDTVGVSSTAGPSLWGAPAQQPNPQPKAHTQPPVCCGLRETVCCTGVALASEEEGDNRERGREELGRGDAAELAAGALSFGRRPPGETGRGA